MTRLRAGANARLRPMPRVTRANLAVALLSLPLLSALARAAGVAPSPPATLAVRWLVLGTVVGVAVGIEGCTLGDVGFRRPTAADGALLVATTALAILAFAGTDPLVAALGLPVSAGDAAVAADVGLTIGLAGAVTTGVVEEALYRGYAIERLADFSGSPRVAGAVSWATFTLAHAVVWPLGDLVQVAAVAAVFTAVYLRRRTLAPVLGAHALVWCLAVLGQFYG